jgi:hypothetical protein
VEARHEAGQRDGDAGAAGRRHVGGRAAFEPGRDRPRPRVALAGHTGPDGYGQRDLDVFGQDGQPALLVDDEVDGDLPARQSYGQVRPQAVDDVVPAVGDGGERARQIRVLRADQAIDKVVVDVGFRRRGVHAATIARDGLDRRRR